MNKKITIISIVLGIALIVMGVSVMAQAHETKKEYNLKIIYEDKLVFNENLAENKEVLIKFNEENTILENIKMTENKKIKLEPLDIPEQKIISYWKKQSNENKEIISPILIDEKDFNITFYAGMGAMIKDRDIIVPTLTKSVERGELLSDIMPQIQSEKNINTIGWYTIEENEVEIEVKKDKKKSKKKDEKKKETKIIQEYKELEYPSTREVTESMDIYALSFPDVNNNNKDDRKEEINLKVNFNLNDEVVEEKIHVGQPVKLATPVNDEYIFLGWYLDPEFEEEYNGEALVRDTTIYAKWKTPQEFVMSRDLIKDEEISNRVEDYLDETNHEIYIASKKRDEQKAKEREKEKEDKSFGIANKRYVLKNYNKEQTYFVKFLNDEEFLFSVALPYGNTIELLNENGQKVKEYSVRQNVSINLNELISVSEIPNFEAKTINRNNANILQIFPQKNKELND